MNDAILVINAGSSSIKFALFDAERLSRAAHGQIAAIDTAPCLKAFGGDGKLLSERHWPAGQSHEDFLGGLLDWIDGHLGGARLAAAGHRIVHGGTQFRDPVRIDAETVAALERLIPLAPLHQPHNLSPVRALMRLRPGLVQIGCFDTAFHRTLPAVAARFALPRALEEEGVRRYGFHGLSYEYIAGRLKDVAPDARKVAVAHLGNGASVCAMLDGKSIDTSMGFSALDGLVMGTRPGRLDPGVLLYLLRQGKSADALEDMLYHHSGLLGVSGISDDMRDLLASPAPAARDAIALFLYRAAREIAALMVGLEGLDMLVFTAGIGENAPAIRAGICAQLAWAGVALDETANRANARRISRLESAIAVLVIPTDEEAMIAAHVRALTA